MKEAEFIEFFKEALEIDDDVMLETKIEDIYEWDSIGILTIIGMADEDYDLEIDPDDLEGVNTLNDVYKLFS